MREKEPTTSIIYVRHGKTDFPTDRIYCDDREDPPLNAVGIAQAQAAARLLRAQLPIDAIYISPSRRTRMTCDAIGQVVQAPIFERHELRERRFGAWDGLYFKDIAANYPDDYQLWRQDPVYYTPQGGETIDGLLGRVTTFITKIARDHVGKTILVVSHVGPIRVCLTEAMKIPLAQYRQLRIDYAGLSRVDYGKQQNNLVYANVTNLLFDL